MVFIDVVKLEKAIKEYEERFNYAEREYLLILLQRRINESNVKSKRKEIVADTLNNNPLMKTVNKILGGDENHTKS